MGVSLYGEVVAVGDIITGEEVITDDKLFSGIDSNIIIGLLVVGIAIVLIIRYFFKFQQFKMENNDVSLKFEPAYIIGFVLALAISFAVSYVFVFNAMPEINPNLHITNIGSASLIAIVIGAVSSYLIDKCIVHPYIDGTRVSVKNFQKLASIRTSGTIYIDPVLREKIVAKGKLYGLNDDQCEKMCLLVKDENDPQFPIIAGFVKKN